MTCHKQRGKPDTVPRNDGKVSRQPGLQQIGITPTTNDPAIATVFATGSGTSYGNGIVQVALPADLAGIEVSPLGNASTSTLAQLESEFAVSVAPAEFANLASTTITSIQARSILSNMGISVPANIGVGDITSTLQVTRRLTSATFNSLSNRRRNSVNKWGRDDEIVCRGSTSREGERLLGNCGPMRD